MVRQMKILIYFVALTLLCSGAKADSGEHTKKKIVSISNKGKADIAIRCTSGVTVFNKYLKPEESTRWKLPAKSHTGICHVDIKGKGGGQGYLSVFVESEWRVFDDGIVKLRLGSGAWKSFHLVNDEESARGSCGESPAPERHYDAKSLAPAPMTIEYPSPPTEPRDQRLKPRNPRPWGTPSPLKNREPELIGEHTNGAPSPFPEHVKSPPPKNREHTNGAPSPLPEHIKSPPPKNWEHTNGAPGHVKSPPPKNREHTNGAPPGHFRSPPPKSRGEPSRAPSPIEQRPRDFESPPPEANREETHWESPPPRSEEETDGAPSPQPDKDDDDELPPLPQPGSTFYTCIKEDTE